jgi:hypothetical protein
VSENPYEAPEARVDDPVLAASDAAAERAAHLGREAGLRAVGVLCLLFGLYFGLIGAAFVVGSREAADDAAMGVGMGVVFALLGVLGLATAWGYFALRPWVRVLSAPVALVAVLMTFFTTLPLVGYAAWLTWSRAGKRVLSPDYAGVRAQARHLRAWTKPVEALVVLGVFAAYVTVAVLVFRDWKMPD